MRGVQRAVPKCETQGVQGRTGAAGRHNMAGHALQQRNQVNQSRADL